ncbi:hypothetical protein ASPCADRAFT_163670 [Aspergillus carbonarius ITEM 5010]|uniref:Uncharacterized protein n=1 Tax=Aspergillus carbonarius (strain ITEM 5010) TaxID=602072 RepID=A0A1R3RTB6_ASPC5|nr:hypothetical protein ASPCADRAFT_163539 [Aspergillus carbonarius ITEM 5010]OOF97739.1 hypothetical protein ASPCADRAFT_163670 [Aspergillus carbonarius ITEM 5010]
MESRVLLDEALSLLEAVLSHLYLRRRKLLVQGGVLQDGTFIKKVETAFVGITDESARHSLFFQLHSTSFAHCAGDLKHTALKGIPSTGVGTFILQDGMLVRGRGFLRLIFVCGGVLLLFGGVAHTGRRIFRLPKASKTSTARTLGFTVYNDSCIAEWTELGEMFVEHIVIAGEWKVPDENGRSISIVFL